MKLIMIKYKKYGVSFDGFEYSGKYYVYAPTVNKIYKLDDSEPWRSCEKVILFVRKFKLEI
jgi:hypothetical protein